MGVTVSPQLLLSATASPSHLLSPPACTLCGQHLLQEISKCGVLHWLQRRYLLWCGPPQPARDPLLWCPECLLPSFFSGLGVHTTVPHSLFYPPLLPECWFCLFLNLLPQRHHYLSHKAVSGPAASFCLFSSISLSSLLYPSTFPSSVFASYLFSLPYSSPSVFSLFLLPSPPSSYNLLS